MSILNIGVYIKKYRKQKKMTQEVLALKTGLSIMSIRRYETGERSPTLDQVKLIASSLEVSYTDLFGSNEIMDEMKNELTKVLLIAPPSDIDSIFTAETAPVIKYTLYNDEVYLIRAYLGLNENGKKEALKRVTELGLIDKYSHSGDKV